MTDLIKDVQKLEIADSLITLYELELDSNITTSSYAYFHGEKEADLTNIQFYNSTPNSTTGLYELNTYTAIPMQIQDIEASASGPAGNPVLTIANILTTFSDALDGLTNDDMLGKKIIRRRTLYKYCYGQSSATTNQALPIEFPKETWIINRIASESKVSVSFELASPFDISGTKLPKRAIIGNACPWIYQASAAEIPAAEQVGSCTWCRFSRVRYNQSDLFHYIDKEDEPILLKSILDGCPTWFSSVDINKIYKTAKTGLIQILPNGTHVSNPTNVYDYWQARKTISSPGTPTDTNIFFRRIRAYQLYDQGQTYYAYTDFNYNDYILYKTGEHSSDNRTEEDYSRIWKIKRITQEGGAHKPVNKPYPQFGAYWERGDMCGKTLYSCSERFQYKPTNIKNITTIAVDGDHDTPTDTITIAAANSSIKVGQLVTSDNDGAPSGFGIFVPITVKGISSTTLTLSTLIKIKDTVTLTLGYVGPDIVKTDGVMPFGGFPASRRLGR